MKENTLPRSLLVWQIDKILIVLCGAFILPFIFHIISQSTISPLGSIWLPIFYAPLISVVFYRRHVSIFVALVAPWINMVLMGMPKLPMAKVLTFELIVFVALSTLIYRANKRFWVLGTISYMAAKTASIVLTKGFDVAVIVNSLFHAMEGLVALAVIGFIAIRQKEKTEA